MKIYPDTKVYILCPANIHSGGPELLHQLCSQMIQLGIDACMLYTSSESVADPVHPLYKKYHVPYQNAVVDDERNVLILPESAPNHLYAVKNIRRVFWWLSVDNYLNPMKNILVAAMNNLAQNALAHPLPKISAFSKYDGDVEHWVQSEYARQFIKLNGVTDDKIRYVSDYLNPAFLSKASAVDLTSKENWVAFNPRKGFEITNLLMSVAPEINWQPIHNMTPEQVQELLAKCKVYIDFGNHPGKDRIPREAAISGCVVITGRRGSAANNVDVNIPDEFKFDDRNLVPAQVIGKINEAFDNFEVEYYKQRDYRRGILTEKIRFAEDVSKSCEIPPPPRDFASNSMAIFGLTDISIAVAKFLLNDYTPTFIIDDAPDDNFPNLRVENNCRYVYIDANHRLEVISTEDANFLYTEGRIKYLAMFNPTTENIRGVALQFNVTENRLLIIK